ncbi:hypothetical protein DCC35_02805 [Mangrovivirga cuniculi]|uniref:Uncharacterized protein n=1 Tax=Mangrovivirga cuniculi TaxID=2715131 RepID=A0A4D7JJY1_9BACT|nr:hypothetical protein DCC35_02805 [Mangrovivirga cuniculi]
MLTSLSLISKYVQNDGNLELDVFLRQNYKNSDFEIIFLFKVLPNTLIVISNAVHYQIRESIQG